MSVTAKRLTLLLCLAALALPASAAAKGGGADRLAASACAQERRENGRAAFEKKYGDENAMRNCVRRNRGRARAALRGATQECQAELAEVGTADFAEEWGSDDTGADAFTECVAYTAEELLSPSLPADDEEEDEL